MGQVGKQGLRLAFVSVFFLEVLTGLPAVFTLLLTFHALPHTHTLLSLTQHSHRSCLPTDPAFHFRVRALEDVYRVLGTASCAVQRTQALPWERQASQQQVVHTLGDMKVSLISQYKKSPSAAELLIAAEKEKLWPSLLEQQQSLPVPEVSSV